MRGSWLGTDIFAVSLRFLAVFALGVAAVLASLGTLEAQRLASERQEDRVRLALTAGTLGQDLRDVIATLRIIRNSDQLRNYVSHTDRETTQHLTDLFRTLEKHDGHYDQMRVLGLDGRERVRVDYANGQPTVVSQGELQSKSDRYYFTDALDLSPSEIYVSPLDLNVEHGVIEQPLKPTIRVAAPLFDERGGRAGVLVLNYRAEGILARFRQGTRGSAGDAMLLNRDGYWLSSANPADEWGFQLPGRASFAQRYPEAWAQIREADAGDIQTSRGRFLFDTVHLSELVRSDSGIKVQFPQTDENYWKLVTALPPSTALTPLAELFRTRSGVTGSLIAVVALASLLVAVLRTNNLRQAAALRESEERFGLAIRGANEGLFDWQIAHNRVFFSPRWKSMLGYRGDEIGDSIDEWTSRLHPEDKERALAQLNDHVRGRTDHYESVYRLRHKSGRYIRVQCRGLAVRNAQGRALRMVGTCLDITERYRTEERLRQAAVVFDNTNEAIVITDSQHHIIAANPAFSQSRGTTRKRPGQTHRPVALRPRRRGILSSHGDLPA